MDKEPKLDFENLTELLKVNEIIDQGQSEILAELFEQCVEVYQNSGELNDKHKRYTEILTELTKLKLGNIDHKSSVILERELLTSFEELSAPKVNIKNLNKGHNIPLAEEDLLFHIDAVKRFPDNQISPTETFALFPQCLCRLTYPLKMIGKKTNTKIKQQLMSIGEKIRTIPEETIDKIVFLAGKIGSFLVTDLKGGGPFRKLNIYELGSVLYRNEAETTFVFSNTSGLIIPSEYLGTPDLNYDRHLYFDKGLHGNKSKLLQIYYQWNQSSTAYALYCDYLKAKNEGRERDFIDSSTKLLLKSFMQPNLEISEGIFGKSGDNVRLVKSTIPVVNKSMLIHTDRDTLTKSINPSGSSLIGGLDGDTYLSELLSQATSMSIDPKWSYNQKKEKKVSASIHFALKKIYDDEETLSIKPMGQILDEKDAIETVSRLLRIGETEYETNIRK